MWSVQNLLLHLCTALSWVSSAAGLIHVFGYEGRDVMVSCPYSQGYEDHKKYLCKNRCGYSDYLITSSENNKTKYSIHDDERTRVFTVFISDLRVDDAGKYWCGVTVLGRDIYTEVKLEVQPEKEEHTAGREKKLEDPPANSTTAVYQHQSSTVRTMIAATSPVSEELTEVYQPQGSVEKTIITTTPPVSEELSEAPSWVSTGEGLIHVFGYEGKDVRISCPYDRGFEDHEKYLCINDCGYSDVLVRTTQKTKTRYFTHDDKTRRIFTVTISDLHHKDAGKYFCGVTRLGKDPLTEVKLELKPDRCCNTVNTIHGEEEGSVSISCPYEPQCLNNFKFFCRGNRPSTCLQQAVITSKNSQRGRIRLMDDRKSSKFMVTISNLTLNDSGLYLCGIQRNSGLDAFSAVELEVKERCCVKAINIRGVVGKPVTFECRYPPQHHNGTMLLCKGDPANNCKDMMDQSRFTLSKDSPTSLSVTIAKLEAGDGGTYWCRSGPESSVGTYTHFHLSVDEGHHALLALPAVLLLLVIIVLVLVYKKKYHKK